METNGLILLEHRHFITFRLMLNRNLDILIHNSTYNPFHLKYPNINTDRCVLDKDHTLTQFDINISLNSTFPCKLADFSKTTYPINLAWSKNSSIRLSASGIIFLK